MKPVPHLSHLSPFIPLYPYLFIFYFFKKEKKKKRGVQVWQVVLNLRNPLILLEPNENDSQQLFTP